MRTSIIGAALAALSLALAGSAVGQAPSPAAAPVRAAPAIPQTPSQAHPVTADDVDAWLDGFVPYALRAGNIAGAVVVVVKDGQVLTEKGYGFADVETRKPVDPKTTGFRPGSVSKLFTWTAVMQQVEQGKLDLDRDVNAYLDFRIPPFQGQPITLRDLMTHTSGFEETIQEEFVGRAGRLTSLETYVKRHLPRRIFPPHAVPAYSNYGAALAGYIVQRVSGEPYDAYIERHIFTPLDMTHSSFRQPLPAALVPMMSKGYRVASQPAPPYELINVRPAGSLSASGDDMAHFMIAHLGGGQYNGQRILQPATEKEMQTAQHAYNPPLPAMALGFYHEDRNGHQIVGHAGDSEAFHSDLHLLPDDNIGLFISMNSLGAKGAAEYVRMALLSGFMDRYFPIPSPIQPAIASARADAKVLDGSYVSSRRFESSFLRILNLLGQGKVISDAKGIVTVAMLKDAAGAPLHWHEIAPFVWQDDSGENRLQANVKDGKVVDFATDILPPAFEFQPAPAWGRASWSLPLMGAMVGAFILTLVMWPVAAIVRRRYGKNFALEGRAAVAYRLVRLAAIADLLGLGVYLAVFALLLGGQLFADASSAPILWTAQILCLLAYPAALVALWNLWMVWTGKGRGWFARVWSLVLALSALTMVWFVLSLKLVTLSLHY